MMSQLPKVGQNLRRLRNSLGLSLDEASKLTGVSKASRANRKRRIKSYYINIMENIIRIKS